MIRSDLESRARITTEAVNTIDLLTEEYQIPPVLTCLVLTKFCTQNLSGFMANRGIPESEELTSFIESLGELEKILTNQINEQYLQLNTLGTA